jgi:hypothetical protein
MDFKENPRKRKEKILLMTILGKKEKTIVISYND